jgi:hypothetical protein
MHVRMMLELGDRFESFSPPSPSEPLRRWFDFFYGLLLKQYKCEYVYKNLIATKVFLSRHSLSASLMTDELRSGASRADLAILNGTSTVYEIKSQYDSFDRLDRQLLDYKKIFDRICVVTTYSRAVSAMEQLEPLIGIVYVRDDGVLCTMRDPSSNKANTEPTAVFSCMRQSEYCSALLDYFGFVPHVPNSQLYRVARDLFATIPAEDAHDLMVKHIKKRSKSRPFLSLMDSTPLSLKHSCLSFSKSKAMASSIATRLEEGLI